eukprot:scaffold26916_cov63-Phaeocystis_antarctica.AAC.2
MGGHPGLRPFWLWLELGSRKLPLKIGCICARDWSRVYGGGSDNSPLLYSSLMRGAAAVIKP